MARGGRRPGAGRPATGRTTKVVRIPIDTPDIQSLMDLREIVNEWAKQAQGKSSPRYDKLQQLIKELGELIES